MLMVNHEQVAPAPVNSTAKGLYEPSFEHDACGVAWLATLTGEKRHDIVSKSLEALRNLDHRGASGAEVNSGDGAGILTQIPDAFFRSEVDFSLPESGEYAVGIAFLSTDASDRDRTKTRIAEISKQEGLLILGWRKVPVDPDGIGPTALGVMPDFEQLFVKGANAEASLDLDRLTYVLRKRTEHELGIYFSSLSSRTIVYKGMLTTKQLEPFFPDLSDQKFASAIGLVHSRFSTNTFPSWPLAHPYRYIAHNGEINTIKGNRNWMKTRESQLATDLIPGDISRVFPICPPGGSDSASLDEVIELLHLSGRSLPHALLMLIPEAWENHKDLDPAVRDFYQFHSNLTEPWDGPANVSFTDGTLIGSVLDRNGLRPGRYWVTNDGLVVLASESGVLDIPQETVIRKGRLQPGRMFLVDVAQGRIIEDEEIKQELARSAPYGKWVKEGNVNLSSLPDREHIIHTPGSVIRRQQTFGYTEEELRLLLAPMARDGGEALGSMGTDTPIAILSERPRLLFDYFTQLFAQVTNPPLDAIREELVTSLSTSTGPEVNLLTESAAHCLQLTLPFPVIDNDELAKIIYINRDGNLPGLASVKISGLYNVRGGSEALAARIEEIFAEVSAAVAQGERLIVLSDRDSSSELAPIPSLLLTAAVHHHLIRERNRTKVGLIIEAGDVREVHHVALLIGYGAAAVNPYLAMESVENLVRTGVVTGVQPEIAVRNLVKGLGKGLLKVMSKMGISTAASYTGAQVFEAIGLAQDLVDKYFTGTPSRLGGIGLEVIAKECEMRHTQAYPATGISPSHRTLNVGGEYQWRREGEPHLFDPETIFRLQHATRSGKIEIFRQYTDRVNEQAAKVMTLRGLFEFKSEENNSVPIEEVEPVSEIVKRFSTGAMSYGSISQEAHETLAIAMNRIGAKSNTGEGGEDPERYILEANGDSKRSAIKQVASGRFGVTSEYLVNADDIQIKMAQGAKPGEGGQLPGHKVYPWIAKTRYSTPGVGLISPPPHHDIYSIEDLAQLIHDLKNANDQARIHVKLVSEVGIGTVAAGVAKAHADVVLVSGHDGGTGAAPLTSLKHAGAPWEIGLAETQQTLLLNGLRDRIVVQADGQLKTGRDVVIAALLGAEEYGFATAPLVVMGCIMMRVCHLDTCPVGVATQNLKLRERFEGQADHVVNFFEFIGQEVREILAELGLRSLDEAVGRVDLLNTVAAIEHWKLQGIDLSPIFHSSIEVGSASLRQTVLQDHGLVDAIDNQLIAACQSAIENAEPVSVEFSIRNVNRTVGTMLGSRVTRAWGGKGLPEDTIQIKFIGSAGQSFGAFLPSGVTLRLEGDANDYVGKGLSGGKIAIRPSAGATFIAEENIIAGNVIGYGATSGKIMLRGRAGERFAVRNSGATLITEGIGDHGCEYMTGGFVVVLGATGRNFAAGMSGGVAYVLDLQKPKVNLEMVTLQTLDAKDRELLHDLLSEHIRETDSKVAQDLIGNWIIESERITKVMPTDYQRVLQVQSRAISDGLDPNLEVMKLFAVSGTKNG